MDFTEIKIKSIAYAQVLLKNKIHPDVLILFGSHAKKTNKKESDVDIALVSRDFGKNPIKEGAKANRLLWDVFPEAEVVTISLDDYMSHQTESPILSEVLKTGIVIL